MSTTVETDIEAVLNIDRDGKLPFTRNRLRGVSVTVLGRKGSGKSTTVRVLAEELLKRKVNQVVVDPQDEYYTLAESYDILVAGRSRHVSLQLDPAKAGALAEFSLTRGLPVVLSLVGYGADERFTLLRNYFMRLWELEEDLRRPYVLVLEEAHKFLPQVGTTPVFDVLSDCFLLGRKNGLSTILATQRSAKIHKDTVSQAEIFFLHKVGHPNDLDVYSELLPIQPRQVREMVSRLRKGSAIVLYEDESMPEDVPTDVIMQVQVRQPETRHVGATPTFEEEEPITLRQLDESVLGELQQLLAEAQPRESAGEVALKRRVAVLEGALAEQERARELLEQEVAKRDELIAGLETQVALLSKITLSVTGVALPDVAALLPAALLSIEQARVGQVTLEGQGLQLAGSEQASFSAEAQQLVEAIAQRLGEIVQSDALIRDLREELARFVAQEGQVAAQAKDQLDQGSDGLTIPQQRKLKGLITRLKKLSRFQRCLLCLLIKHEGKEFSYEELSRELRYMLSTVRGESTTALQREGLVQRATTLLGYTSRFTDYCLVKYPGAHVSLIREPLLSQLVVE